ncbi:DUF6387 family protein [Salmonella enterica subsp. enterica]
MKRINSVSDLPKSFSLSKYDGIEQLSGEDFFSQVRYRFEAWRFNPHSYTAEALLQQGILYDGSNHMITLESAGFYSISQKSETLSSGFGISPASRADIIDVMLGDGFFNYFEIYDLVRKGKFDEIQGDGVNHHKAVSCEVKGSDFFNREVMVNIDLSLGNDLLIREFSKVLNKWRKELDVPEPEYVSNKWPFIYKKIIDYKALPFIDLRLWAKAMNVCISDNTYSHALFPDGGKGKGSDYMSLNRTVKPFVKKLMTFETLEKMREFV